ncbi:MAG: PorT family protein, partial [Prevotella sp.]|nr:PorT family protein [Prevotella sp.]
MKKLFTLVALMAMVLSAQAQHEEGDFTIQPRAGITFSNLSDGDKWKIAPTFGVEFEHFLNDEFSLAAGVLFTNQGCVYNPIDNTSDEKIKMHVYYGTLPIMANLYVLPGFAIKAGIQPGFRVKAKIQQGSTTIDLD